MKVVVFGGSGFLGSHVCDAFTRAGHDVVVADRRPSAWLLSGQEMKCGDILDEVFVNEACTGVDAVLNFAGIADLSDAALSPVRTAEINVMGNVNILEACCKHKVDKYIFASSLYVYGHHGGFYRCSKQACELFIDTYHQQYGLRYAILRYGSVYGPRTDPRNGIHRFVREAMMTGEITYYGTGDAIREYIHVEDAAGCTLEIVGKNLCNDNIVLTGSQTMKASELFAMIGEILGKNIKVNYHNEAGDHYKITPYSFMPKLGKKMFPEMAIDLGQGILSVMNEIYHESGMDREDEDE